MERPNLFRHYQGSKPPEFGHPIELEFARVLDYHGLAWMHEPREFVLRARTPEGEEVEVGPQDLVDGCGLPRGWVTVESFRPDFYLPEQDRYIETTVMKQSLVTRKNRKARLTRERYGVRVMILYRRDFEILAQRYGFNVPAPGGLDVSPPALEGLEGLDAPGTAALAETPDTDAPVLGL